jgi:hypothetical protein
MGATVGAALGGVNVAGWRSRDGDSYRRPRGALRESGGLQSVPESQWSCGSTRRNNGVCPQ